MADAAPNGACGFSAGKLQRCRAAGAETWSEDNSCVVAARSARWRVWSLLAPRHPAFCPKTGPLRILKQALRREMLEKMDGKLGDNHSGELRMENAQARAERIISEELGRLGWGEADLAARRKGGPEKMALAARLRRETTLSVKAIAARVHLGTAKSANARPHERRHNGKPAGGAATLHLGL